VDLLPIYWYLIAGFVLGLIGQLTRILVGIKKQYDSTNKDLSQWFNPTRLIISLVIGGLAGLFAGLFLSGQIINSTFYLAVIAAGYAGADFIEGFLQKEAPKYTTEELTNAAQQNPDVVTKVIQQNPNIVDKVQQNTDIKQ
jgi:uncharacterized membrane protein YeaQ/YmgE (transglycosylase-associated protein family)